MNEYQFVNLEEYKGKIEEIHQQLNSQSDMTFLHRSHSEEYRESLRKEIQLLEEKRKLVSEYDKELKNNN